MDAPFLAVTAGVAPITPLSNCNLLYDPVSDWQKLLLSTANDDDDEVSRKGLTKVHMSLQMRSDDDVDHDVRLLRPSRSTTPHDGFKSSQWRTSNGTRMTCGFVLRSRPPSRRMHQIWSVLLAWFACKEGWAIQCQTWFATWEEVYQGYSSSSSAQSLFRTKSPNHSDDGWTSHQRVRVTIEW